MKKPSDPPSPFELTRNRIIGLGERTARKSYYPQLQQRIRELRQSELRYRALFEDSPTSLWEEDFSRLKRHFDHLRRQGVQDFDAYFRKRPEETTRCIRMVRIRDVNKATLALYEAGSKQELMANIRRIMPVSDLDVLRRELVAMATEAHFEIECVNHTLTGQQRHLLIRSSIPPGYETTWGKVFVSAFDLTGRVQAEAEKKKLERQLRQAQKMEAVGTLAGGIAHDFNNILSAVIGFTEMALEDATPESFLRRNMEQVLQAGMRAKHLVQQILAFSRQSDQELRPVQLKRTIVEACELLRASLPSTIAIRTRFRTNVFTMSDPTQMHQVLMNLCTNAAHAMRTHGGTLSIVLDAIDDPAPWRAEHPELTAPAYVRLTVSDSGHGISEQIIERIFDPFFTTKEHTEGTGMGLAVVHGIVKSHKGLITVESRNGEGTTFTVLLPQIVTPETGRPQANGVLQTGNESILFVDDEAMLVDLSSQLLKRLGYSVTACTSSLEALSRFRDAPADFDLVITDMTMPQLTGKELAGEMLAIRPGLPIILCTGFSEIITEDDARHAGIRAFIMKPIIMKELAATIRRILDAED
ncbi:MAG: ATP-binding protein [Desulfobacterales bacterium]|jgi:signal transduction histidine kinase/ActR/RegA family two-component response regulator